MSRRLIVRIVVLVALAGALASAPVVSAVAQPTSATAELGQTATLVAKGAAIEVPVIYSCSPDTAFGDIFFSSVTERVGGNRTATGSGSFRDLTCDDAQHTALVTVVSGNGIAFHQGTGFVQGAFEACDQNGFCLSVPLSGTIQIVKK
jgi:hypothetical protein